MAGAIGVDEDEIVFREGESFDAEAMRDGCAVIIAEGGEHGHADLASMDLGFGMMEADGGVGHQARAGEAQGDDDLIVILLFQETLGADGAEVLVGGLLWRDYLNELAACEEGQEEKGDQAHEGNGVMLSRSERKRSGDGVVLVL